MNRFKTRSLIAILCASGLLGTSSQVFASAFQLWEQDGASIGNYHAGYAAEAADASTAWYNPAGMTRIKNPQIVVGGNGIMSDFKYKGSVAVANDVGLPPEFETLNFPAVTSQGGTFSFVPFFHYVSPINDRFGFGFSVDAPFGLKTNYGSTTPLRYAATETAITVVDISPSLAVQATNKLSLGAGFDIQRLYAEFNSVAVNAALGPETDSTSTNKANDTGYGYHLGALYDFTENTRAGISYHSQVVHHPNGYSSFQGPIATFLNQVSEPENPNPSDQIRSHASTRVTLPAYTALSGFSRIMPQVSVMGTVIYTQWNSFQTLTLNGVSGAVADPETLIAPSTSIQVNIPEKYRNTWNLAVGADYYATDTVTLRGGLGYDQTPVKDAYRNVQLPDNDRYIVSVGGHIQATKAVGFDLGWMHIFINQAHIDPPPQVTGAQVVTTSGHVNGGADVIGGQVVWDIV